jgi:hypothetical protein
MSTTSSRGRPRHPSAAALDAAESSAPKKRPLKRPRHGENLDRSQGGAGDEGGSGAGSQGGFTDAGGIGAGAGSGTAGDNVDVLSVYERLVNGDPKVLEVAVACAVRSSKDVGWSKLSPLDKLLVTYKDTLPKKPKKPRTDVPPGLPRGSSAAVGASSGGGGGVAAAPPARGAAGGASESSAPSSDDDEGHNNGVALDVHEVGASDAGEEEDEDGGAIYVSVGASAGGARGRPPQRPAGGARVGPRAAREVPAAAAGGLKLSGGIATRGAPRALVSAAAMGFGFSSRAVSGGAGAPTSELPAVTTHSSASQSLVHRTAFTPASSGTDLSASTVLEARTKLAEVLATQANNVGYLAAGAPSTITEDKALKYDLRFACCCTYTKNVKKEGEKLPTRVTVVENSDTPYSELHLHSAIETATSRDFSAAADAWVKNFSEGRPLGAIFDGGGFVRIMFVGSVDERDELLKDVVFSYVRQHPLFLEQLTDVGAASIIAQTCVYMIYRMWHVVHGKAPPSRGGDAEGEDRDVSKGTGSRGNGTLSHPTGKAIPDPLWDKLQSVVPSDILEHMRAEAAKLHVRVRGPAASASVESQGQSSSRWAPRDVPTNLIFFKELATIFAAGGNEEGGAGGGGGGAESYGSHLLTILRHDIGRSGLSGGTRGGRGRPAISHSARAEPDASSVAASSVLPTFGAAEHPLAAYLDGDKYKPVLVELVKMRALTPFFRPTGNPARLGDLPRLVAESLLDLQRFCVDLSTLGVIVE